MKSSVVSHKNVQMRAVALLGEKTAQPKKHCFMGDTFLENTSETWKILSKPLETLEAFCRKLFGWRAPFEIKNDIVIRYFYFP